MAYNYLTSPYLRVRRADGAVAWIAPAELAATGEARPVAFAFGLPVLDIFATELLIGLFQYAVAPASERDLLRLLRQPPDSAALRDIFADAATGFDVYGETPAFQDRSLAGKKPSSISRLFPVTPDAKPNAFKATLWPLPSFVRVEVAMLGLAFLQAHCSGGGAGYRTSLSGGGPLRTWVQGVSLYHTVLCNLLPRNQFQELGADDGLDQPRLPWFAPYSGTRTRDNTPAEAVYFACPRRVLLPEPVLASGSAVCGITGEPGGYMVDGVIEASGGINYESYTWRHPLTPYYHTKTKGVIYSYPRRGTSVEQRNAWRERSGLYASKIGEDGQGVSPAEIVRVWRDERARQLGWTRIPVRCFGLQFVQQAKVGGIADFPFVFRAFPAESTTDIRLFEEHLGDVVRVGGEIAWWLRLCLVEALNGEGKAKEMPRDLERERQIAFWQETEPAFQAYVDDLAEALAAVDDVAAALASPERQRARLDFQRDLKDRALRLFDAVTEAALTTDAAKDVTVARLKLRRGADKSAHGGIEQHLLESEQA